ncbi:MAG: ATP-dependent Lon protease, partial [Paracrocinitomix sp.]
MSTTKTTTLPLLPIPNDVFFPDMVVTVEAQSPGARAAFAAAAETDGKELVAVPQLGGDYSPIGIVVRIEQQGQLPGGGEGAVLRGIRRVRIGQGETGTDGVLHVTVTEVDEGEPTAEAKALAIEYRGTAMELLRLVGGSRLVGMLDGVEDPGALADTIGLWPDLGDDRRRELFETVDVTERITKATAWVKEALAEVSVNHDINSTVQEGFEKDQREAILRRQMASIQEELGESDDDEIAGYRARLAEGELPETVAKAAEKELDKLERMSDQSMESGWIRTWLETVFELPWGARSQDKLDLDDAQAQLDADHTGLDKVKERIIEFLAVRKLRAERNVDTTGKAGG